ncbi:hypothetical protein GCM10018966_095560 [Streptomyces yanii]
MGAGRRHPWPNFLASATIQTTPHHEATHIDAHPRRRRDLYGRAALDWSAVRVAGTAEPRWATFAIGRQTAQALSSLCNLIG